MKNIQHLRESLFETIELLKKGEIDVSQAKAISDIGQVIVNSAKAETDFVNIVGGSGSGFIAEEQDVKQIDRPKAEYSNKGHLSVAKKYIEP